MKNLSVFINTKTSEFYLSTNIKKIILNGKPANYSLLVILPKHDTLLDPAKQERVYRYISKRSKATLLKCDAEHNIFLSADARRIIEAVKKYAEGV
jgi:alpha-beta hydrolase superfamily lysophospholipase